MKGGERKLSPPALRPWICSQPQTALRPPSCLPCAAPNARKSLGPCRILHPLQAEGKWAVVVFVYIVKEETEQALS